MLGACASTGGAGSAGTSPVPVTVSAQQGGTSGSMAGVTMMVGSAGQTAQVGASRDAVWAKLPGAYESLGLPISIKDDARFRIGNDQIKARRALNGVSMRTIVDCGSDLNGEKAESYDIRLTIETTVAQAASADAAEVTTMVSGLGRSPNFGNNDVSCSTKGELERRILRYVRTQLGLTEK
ncbi:MAG: hypothetical protein H7099_15000 [Gemmatimonadaceae bacterium]|nr:hypothetical protein [Gemmatimonadaceae bacterium]